MADSCEWIFHLFGRHHCMSGIFEMMENFQNDCCCPWTKKPFKYSYSRQLRIVNAVVSWSPAGQMGDARYTMQVNICTIVSFYCVKSIMLLCKEKGSLSCSLWRSSRLAIDLVYRAPAGQIDWPKSVFLQTKAIHFEAMMTTADEVNRDKTKIPA